MINKWMQEALLKAKRVGPVSFRGFYVNDKVVYCGENDDSVTNATNGVIVQASQKDLTIEWDTGNRMKFKKIGDISLSYAITAHKSQGSEYPKVLVACYDVEKMKYCVDRRWLYTSVMRGKEEVVLLGTKKLEAFVKMPLKPLPISDIICVRE